MATDTLMMRSQPASGGPEDEIYDENRIIIREGVLWKQGQGGPLHRKNWKERYFMLRKGVIEYYVEKGGEIKGKLDISHCSYGSIEILPEDSKKTGSSKSTVWRFAINTGLRRLLLSAASDADMFSWIRDIRKAFPECEYRLPMPADDIDSDASYEL